MPKVYCYDCRIVENEALVMAQIRLAHEYRNKLCEIEQKRRAATDQLLASSCPRLTEVEAQLLGLDDQIDKCVVEIKSENTKQKKRIVPSPERKAELTELREQRKVLYEERRELRTDLFGISERAAQLKKVASDLHSKPAATIQALRAMLWDGCDEFRAALAARSSAPAGEKRAVDALIRRELALLLAAESHSPAVTQELQRIDQAAKSAVTAARRDARLYWGTYLSVDEAASKFRGGRPPQFRCWKGEGKIAQQFQQGLSVAEAFSDNPQFCIDSQNQRATQSAPLHLVRMRCGPNPTDFTQLRVALHRPLPHDASIKWVYLVCRRTGTHTRWRLQFVLDRTGGFAREDRAESGVVAIDIGWRRIEDGIQVAHWQGSDGEEGILTIPDEWARRLPQCDELESIRDKMLDGAREVLKRWRNIETERYSPAPEWLSGQAAWLKYELRKPVNHPIRLAQLQAAHTAYCGVFDNWEQTPAMPEWLAQATDNVHAWKSQARLAGLVWQWKNQRFVGDEHLYGVCEAWRKQDKHLYEWSCNNRAKFMRWRLDSYRVFARTLARRYKSVVLETVDWRHFSCRPMAEEEDETRLARARKHITSPSELERCLRGVFGSDVIDVPAKNITYRCHVCGQECGEQERWKVVYDCVCGSSWDQDRNAVINLLRAAGCEHVAQEV